MKRLSEEQIEALERRRLEREKHRLLRKYKAENNKERLQRIKARHAARKSKAPLEKNHLRLVLPRILSFRENYQEMAQFLEDFREAVFHHHAPVFLDFSQVETISPAATLVLVAEVFRCRHLTTTKRANGNYPPDPLLQEQLKDMGFYKLINVPDPPGLTGKKNLKSRVDHLKFFSSNQVEAPLAKQLRIALTKGISAIRVEARHRMFESLKEVTCPPEMPPV